MTKPALPMTDGEICTRYKQAKDQAGQIRILAQCNACSETIIDEMRRDNE